jgi:hypothetical protein
VQLVLLSPMEGVRNGVPSNVPPLHFGEATVGRGLEESHDFGEKIFKEFLLLEGNKNAFWS